MDHINRGTPYIYKDVNPEYGIDAKTGIFSLEGYSDSLDIEAVKNSLRNIFLIQKNTVPGKPWFGNPLNRDVFDLFDDLSKYSIEAAIENAIERFEPRVTLENVEVDLMPEFNRIIITIEFQVIIDGHLNKDNLVIPFSHNNFTYLEGRPSSVFVSEFSAPPKL